MKTVNTIEMLEILYKNPYYKAIMVKDSGIIIYDGERICWEDSGNALHLNNNVMSAQWKIIKPEIKVELKDAIRTMRDGGIVQSIVSDKYICAEYIRTSVDCEQCPGYHTLCITDIYDLSNEELDGEFKVIAEGSEK